MGCVLIELMTSGLIRETLWEEQLGNEAHPTQGEVKVNVGDGKPGNTAVFGSGGRVVMEFLSL